MDHSYSKPNNSQWSITRKYPCLLFISLYCKEYILEAVAPRVFWTLGLYFCTTCRRAIMGHKRVEEDYLPLQLAKWDKY